MQTQRTYFYDSYQFLSAATITSSGEDENGPYVTLESTIFYPQGGGQPSDVGTISVDGNIIDVVTVRTRDDEVRHYTNKECANFVGKRAALAIDQEKRLLHMRLHSAGHLLSLAVERLYPHLKAIKGHHFPECPYVEFVSAQSGVDLVSLEAVNREIVSLIAKEYPISSISGEPIRLVRIGEFSSQPCGGTHVKNLKELAGLVANKQKIKANTLRITYH